MTTPSLNTVSPIHVRYALADVFAAVSAELDTKMAEQEQYKGIDASQNYAKAILDNTVEGLTQAKAQLETWKSSGVTVLETDAPFTDGSLTNTDIDAMAARQINSGRIGPARASDPMPYPSAH